MTVDTPSQREGVEKVQGSSPEILASPLQPLLCSPALIAQGLGVSDGVSAYGLGYIKKKSPSVQLYGGNHAVYRLPSAAALRSLRLL